jgi:hypothetical protein
MLNTPFNNAVAVVEVRAWKEMRARKVERSGKSGNP